VASEATFSHSPEVSVTWRSSTIHARVDCDAVSECKPRAQPLESAGERAQAAFGQLASANGAGEWGKRIDEAWRRDALRAVLSLQRAPEEMAYELRRQRFRSLRAELKLLGLDQRPCETLTEADVKAARVARVKALQHPDSRTKPRARGLDLFGARLRSLLPEEEPDSEEGRVGALQEVNAACEAVRQAVTRII